MKRPDQSMPRASLWRYHMQNAGNILLDRILGIDTAGWVDNETLGFDTDEGNPYQPSNWVNLFGVRSVLRGLKVTKQDAFIDYGCGKGQVLALAARFPFGRVIGLDLSADMVAVAERNAVRLRPRMHCDTLELVHMNALDYDLPDDITVCYFYMTFPTPVFEQVIARIAASAVRHPRKIHILYLRPTADDLAVPERHGFTLAARQRDMAVFAN